MELAFTLAQELSLAERDGRLAAEDTDALYQTLADLQYLALVGEPEDSQESYLGAQDFRQDYPY